MKIFALQKIFSLIVWIRSHFKVLLLRPRPHQSSSVVIIACFLRGGPQNLFKFLGNSVQFSMILARFLNILSWIQFAAGLKVTIFRDRLFLLTFSLQIKGSTFKGKSQFWKNLWIIYSICQFLWILAALPLGHEQLLLFSAIRIYYCKDLLLHWTLFNCFFYSSTI